TGQHFYCCCLSGTVCTKQPKKFSFFNKQTKSVYGCPLFKLFSQIIYSNAVHLSSSSFCSCSPNTFSTSSSYKSLLIIAIPCFSSPRSSTLSPGLKLKISLASFGITICPFDPLFAVQACLSSGLVIICPPKSMFCMNCMLSITYHTYSRTSSRNNWNYIHEIGTNNYRPIHTD